MTQDSGEIPNANRVPQASWSHVAFTALACLTGGGGIGSLATGSSVSAKLEVTRTEVLGKLEQIKDQLDDLDGRLDDHEDRIRALEQGGKE